MVLKGWCPAAIELLWHLAHFDVYSQDSTIVIFKSAVQIDLYFSPPEYPSHFSYITLKLWATNEYIGNIIVFNSFKLILQENSHSSEYSSYNQLSYGLHDIQVSSIAKE